MTDYETPHVSLRLRIKAMPGPGELDEFDLSRFECGGTYDVSPQLASLLIVGGYAEVVARREPLAEAADWSWRKRRN